MPNKTILLFSALAWTAIITVLSLMTLGDMGRSIALPYKDKMVHFVFYFVFVLLWCQFRKTTVLERKTSRAIFFGAVAYGLLMEGCQGIFTTTRTADIYDAIANTAGAFAGLLFVNKVFK